MNPNIWGPHVWYFLNCLALTYPEQPTNNDKLNYKQYIVSLGSVLPCQSCSNHFMKHYNMAPLNNNDLQNRTHFRKWIVNFHNNVNKDLGKPIYEDKGGTSILDGFKFYNKNDNNVSDNYFYKNITIMLSFLVFVLIIVIIYMYYKNKSF